MLFYKRFAIYGNYRDIESNPEHLKCHGIFLRLSVGRHDDCTRQSKEIGIGRRKPVALLVIYGIGKRKPDEIERIPGNRPGLFQLIFHEIQFLEMFILGIIASGKYYRVSRCESGEGVYMGVRVVAGKIPMFKPDTFLGSENSQKIVLYCLPGKRGIAVGL